MSRPSREEAVPVAAEVQRLAEDRGLTNSELARICGVTPQAVGSWFSKPVLITPSVLNTLEDEFGLRHGSILARCGYVDFESSASVADAIESDRRLDSGQRKLLSALYEEFSRG